MDLANEAVTQVRLRCEELLNERIHNLDQNVQSLRSETQDLKTEIRGKLEMLFRNQNHDLTCRQDCEIQQLVGRIIARKCSNSLILSIRSPKREAQRKLTKSQRGSWNSKL